MRVRGCTVYVRFHYESSTKVVEFFEELVEEAASDVLHRVVYVNLPVVTVSIISGPVPIELNLITLKGVELCM